MFTVDEISKETGVTPRILYKRIKELGIVKNEDGAYLLDQSEKDALVNSVSDTMKRKKEAEQFIDDVQDAEVGETNTISDKSGSTLEQRLSIAKKEFDHISKSLAECQVAIELKGTILMNGNNGTISSNPAVKTKCELLKQHNALQKTITELENALKLSVPHRSVIDDE